MFSAVIIRWFNTAIKSIIYLKNTKRWKGSTAFRANYIDSSVLPRVSVMYLATKNMLISADKA